MFEHSFKVPRPYKVAANIFKKVSTEGGSVKTLLYDNKLRFFRTNALFALITETIKHASDLDKLFENFKIFETETRLDPWLAKVLTTELLFGKKTLPGKSKPEQTILSYKEQFEKYVNDHQDELKTEVTRKPRYVRVNTNLLTTSDAIRAFQDEGYRFIRCTSGTYDDYLKQVQDLTEYDFTQDYHVKTVFVFSSGTKLHEHELYLENKIILQDKATALAVHLLAPPPGSIALDLCAAPGMKTTQLAAYMRNEGKIYAVERNEKRYNTLCDFVSKTGSKCVETLNKDSLDIKRGDLDDVEYILLDPSCSGSGMELCVHNYIEATRLAKLTSLQEKFLKHAMNAFPKAKRIVYSTCSLYHEENERVITNVVKTSRAKWRVQDVKELLKEKWNNYGSAMYGSMGTRCLYAKPDSDLTTGFFLAVLDRDEKDFEKSQKNTKVVNDHDIEDTSIVKDESAVSENAEVKKKKSKKKTPVDENTKSFDDKNVSETDDQVDKRKNNKNHEHEIESPDETPVTDVTDQKCKKKKKKNKHKEIEMESQEEVTEELVGKKKKSKGNTEIETQEQTAEDIVVKKKKHKKIEIETLNEISDTNGHNENSKKKKRKKDNDENVVESNEKKKHKHQEVDTEAVAANDIDCEIPNKNKKKRVDRQSEL